MKVWFKRGLFSLVVLAIVTVVGGAIFLLTFNPNSYKQKLADIVQQKYQRTLKIDGDIELSLFPRIGLSVQGLSLSDRNSEDPFASLESARFAVALWPLINNRLVVDHVAVTGFKAWIVRDEEGKLNFDDLLQAPPAGPQLPVARSGVSLLPAAQAAEAPQEKPVEPAPESLPVPELIAKRSGSETDFQIDIAGLSLKGGEIHYFSKRSNVIGRLLQLEVNTGRMTFGQPFDVAFKSRLSGDYPVADGVLEGQGQLSLDPASKSYSAQKLSLSFVGDLDELQAQSLTVKGNVAYKSAQRQFSATNLDTQLQGQWLGAYPVSDLNATLSTPKMQIDSVSDLVSFEKLALRVRGKNEDQNLDLALDVPRIQVSPAQAEGSPVVASLKVSGPRVLGLGLTLQGLSGNSEELLFEQAKLDGAIKQGSRVAQLKASSPMQWQPSNEWLRLPEIQANIRVEDEADAGSRFEMPVTGQADLNKGKQHYSAQLSSSTEQAQGSLDVTLQDKGKGPLLDAVLKADKLDLDELRSIFWVTAPEVVPATEPEPQAEAPEAAAEQEPAAEGGEQTEQQPKAAEADAAPPAEEAPEETTSYAWLDKITFDLRFEIEKLRSLGVVMDQVKAQVKNQGQLINLSQFNAQAYEGQLQAKAKVEPGKRFEMGLKLQQMQVGSLLLDAFGNDYLAGKGNVDLNLKAQGNTQEERLNALEGGLTVDLRDGSWRSVDLDQSVRDINEAVRNAFSGQIPLLLPESDPLRRTVLSRLQGSLDIKKGQATFRNFRATTPILTVTTAKGSTLDLVTQHANVTLQARLNHNNLAADERKSFQDLRNVLIPIHISGPWAALSYQIQWKDIASNSIKKALQDGLLDLLSQQVSEAKTESRPDVKSEVKEIIKEELGAKVPQTVGEAMKQWFKP
ncbi:AsmA family protein [Alcaligenes faecalis]|jgi:AsmA protein|uniref:AsmA family protein n=1 Tax=Alcaligenes faecalis TaxID=511 RepID=A0ABY7N5D5_ALCFA|nr:AsmA family protein [Alcaligenes faecalis]KAA1284032.1 AsmA family protein [Alcaligenes faecalis]OSZ31952.1 AsmA family protein 2 [Alcaligenes faecalis]OSZ39911.1 AsmA family protein 2 [Alcaligenes faecalis]WBM37449.1 AsmA family protein [Alcaligenes faecalis]